MGTPYPNPITPNQTRIGWIGIGVMGGAMAGRLLSAGYSLTVFARNPAMADPLLPLGAHLAASPAAVARDSDVVFTVVGHPQDVRQVLLSEHDGVLPALSPNSVAVDHTSSHPDLAREIAHAARQNRCWAVDAPVSGGDLGAMTGGLSLFAGGDRSVVDWLSPLFEITSHKVSYMGPAGSGQSCKIGNQIAMTGSFKGLSEALFFAGRAGLEKERWLAAAMGGDGGSRVMEMFGKRAVERDLRSGGYVEYLVKGVGMGVDFVESGGGGGGGSVVLPGAAQNKQLLLSMVANGDGKMSAQGLITVMERINGE